MGYSIASGLQTIMMAYAFFVVANVASFGIGCYLFAKTITNEMNSMLHIADKRLALKKEHSLAMKRFIQIVEWHALVKQLSQLKINVYRKKMPTIIDALFPFSLINAFSEVFRHIFMGIFIWSTLGTYESEI